MAVVVVVLYSCAPLLRMHTFISLAISFKARHAFYCSLQVSLVYVSQIFIFDFFFGSQLLSCLAPHEAVVALVSRIFTPLSK